MPANLRPGFAAARADEKQLAALYVRISQETFDCAVLENIEELGMDPHEALADAVAQFETQGVNLNNIIQRVPGAAEADPLAVVLIRRVQGVLAGAEEEASVEVGFGTGTMKISFPVCPAAGAEAKLAEAADQLRAELLRDKEGLVLAGHNGGVDALLSAVLSMLESPTSLPALLEALAALLMDAENREALGPRGVGVLSAVVDKHMHAHSPKPLTSAMHAVRAAMLVHEQHRQLFVDSVGMLKAAVTAMDKWTHEPLTVLAACGVLRASTLADDARARTSKGLDHAKAAVELGSLPLLLSLLQSPMAHTPAVLAELLATLSRLTVTDQICADLAGMDALRLAITKLGDHVTDPQVAKQACFFLANIAGNDECKEAIVHAKGHVAIVQAMLLHPNHAGMQTDAVAALGSMALRMPDNCTAIAEAGGLGTVVHALTQHLNHQRMQSKGCLAVRNLVSRNPELREPLLELGVEQPLRTILHAYPDGYMHNLAKAALRELHCSVQLQEGFKGDVGAGFKLEQGDINGENHWDKFLETPGAQEAMKAEMAAMGIKV